MKCGFSMPHILVIHTATSGSKEILIVDLIIYLYSISILTQQLPFKTFWITVKISYPCSSRLVACQQLVEGLSWHARLRGRDNEAHISTCILRFSREVIGVLSISASGSYTILHDLRPNYWACGPVECPVAARILIARIKCLYCTTTSIMPSILANLLRTIS